MATVPVIVNLVYDVESNPVAYDVELYERPAATPYRNAASIDNEYAMHLRRKQIIEVPEADFHRWKAAIVEYEKAQREIERIVGKGVIF